MISPGWVLLHSHGEDDQTVPVKASAKKEAGSSRAHTRSTTLGAPHSITATHQDKVIRDLLSFLWS